MKRAWARELGVVIVLVIELAVFWTLIPDKTDRQGAVAHSLINTHALLDVLTDSCVISVAAVGTTIVIISGGILWFGRYGTVDSTVAFGYELDIIAAAVVGVPASRTVGARFPGPLSEPSSSRRFPRARPCCRSAISVSIRTSSPVRWSSWPSRSAN